MRAVKRAEVRKGTQKRYTRGRMIQKKEAQSTVVTIHIKQLSVMQ
jgi:hypothetical protein